MPAIDPMDQIVMRETLCTHAPEELENAFQEAPGNMSYKSPIKLGREFYIGEEESIFPAQCAIESYVAETGEVIYWDRFTPDRKHVTAKVEGEKAVGFTFRINDNQPYLKAGVIVLQSASSMLLSDEHLSNIHNCLNKILGSIQLSDQNITGLVAKYQLRDDKPKFFRVGEAKE